MLQIVKKILAENPKMLPLLFTQPKLPVSILDQDALLAIEVNLLEETHLGFLLDSGAF